MTTQPISTRFNQGHVDAIARLFQRRATVLASSAAGKRGHTPGMAALRALAQDFAFVFSLDRPSFDEAGFLDRCGVGGPPGTEDPG